MKHHNLVGVDASATRDDACTNITSVRHSERAKRVELLRVERSEQAKARGVADAGSTIKSCYLSK